MQGGDRADYRSLGEILREAREDQGLERDQLAQRTKIHPRMIAALESDDLDQISGPVYARSFVRTLAGELNLDEEWLLTKLENANAAMASTRPSAPAAPAPSPNSSPAPQPSHEASDEQRWKIESVRVRRVGGSRRRKIPLGRLSWTVGTVGLVVLIVWTIAQRMRDYEEGPPPMPTLVEDTERQAATRPLGAEKIAGGLDAGTASAEDESLRSAQRQRERGLNQPGDPVEPAADRPPTSPASQEPARLSTASRNEEYVSDEVVGDRGMRSVLRLELVLQAVAPVSGSVAKGTGREQFVLKAGEIRRFVDPDHFELRLSDPSAVQVLLNGVPQEPPSNLGEAPWFLSLQSLR